MNTGIFGRRCLNKVNGFEEINMRLALVQMPNYGSVELNLSKSLRAVKAAAGQGADLVLFPEVQLTEFFPQYPGQDMRKYAVSIEGEPVKKVLRYMQGK